MIDNESEGKEEMNSDRDKMIVHTQHLMAHCNPRRSKFGLCLMYLGIIVALACIGYILFGESRNNWWIILLLICLPISLLCGGFLIVWAPVESRYIPIETSILFRDGHMFWIFRKPENIGENDEFKIEFSDQKTYSVSNETTVEICEETQFASFYVKQLTSETTWFKITDHDEWTAFCKALREHGFVENREPIIPPDLIEFY